MPHYQPDVQTSTQTSTALIKATTINKGDSALPEILAAGGSNHIPLSLDIEVRGKVMRIVTHNILKKYTSIDIQKSAYGSSITDPDVMPFELIDIESLIKDEEDEFEFVDIESLIKDEEDEGDEDLDERHKLEQERLEHEKKASLSREAKQGKNTFYEGHRPWNEHESMDQYQTRINDYLVPEYIQLLKNGAAIIALQEAPDSLVDARKFFESIKEVCPDYDIAFKFKETPTSGGLMVIYNKNLLGSLIMKPCLEANGQALCTTFYIGGQLVTFKTMHLESRGNMIRDLLLPKTHQLNGESREEVVVLVGYYYNSRDSLALLSSVIPAIGDSWSVIRTEEHGPLTIGRRQNGFRVSNNFEQTGCKIIEHQSAGIFKLTETGVLFERNQAFSTKLPTIDNLEEKEMKNIKDQVQLQKQDTVVLDDYQDDMDHNINAREKNGDEGASAHDHEDRGKGEESEGDEEENYEVAMEYIQPAIAAVAEPVLATQDDSTMKYLTVAVGSEQLVVVTHNTQEDPPIKKYASMLETGGFEIMMIHSTESKALINFAKIYRDDESMPYRASSSPAGITIFYRPGIIYPNSIFLHQLYGDGVCVFGPTLEFNKLHLTIAYVGIQKGNQFNVVELESHQGSTYGIIIGTGFSINQHNDGDSRNKPEVGIWMSSKAKNFITISSRGLFVQEEVQLQQEAAPVLAVANYNDGGTENKALIAGPHGGSNSESQPLDSKVAQQSNTADTQTGLVPHTTPSPKLAYAGASLWLAADIMEAAPELRYACEEILPACNATYITKALRLPQDDISWLRIHAALTMSGYVLIASSSFPEEGWNVAYPAAKSIGYAVRLGILKQLAEDQQARMEVTKASYNNSLAYYGNVVRNCLPAVAVASFVTFFASGPINHLVRPLEPQEVTFRAWKALSAASQSSLLCVAHHEKTFNPNKDISMVGKAAPYVVDSVIMILLVSNMHFMVPNSLPKVAYGVGQLMGVLSSVVATHHLTKALVEIIPNSWSITSSPEHKEDNLTNTETSSDTQETLGEISKAVNQEL